MIIIPRKDNYRPLRQVLMSALEQARSGKGYERHNPEDLNFKDQNIVVEGHLLGLSAPAFQARKKVREAVGLINRGEFDTAMTDLLGAINYIAAMYIVADEKKKGVVRYVEQKDAV